MEAKNLMKKDITVLGKGKSDPYVILTVGAQQFRTQTINNTVDPKWDYWCEVSRDRCAPNRKTAKINGVCGVQSSAWLEYKYFDDM